MNGNHEWIKFLITVLMPMLALAAAWGTIQTRLDNVHATTLKIESDIKEIEASLLDIRIEQAQLSMFRREWMSRWGAMMEDVP